MLENKATLLVTLNIGDLQQLIEQAVNDGMTRVLEVVKLNSKSSDKHSENLYTREEVKKLLRVSYTTLYHWNNDGVLFAHKIKSRVYYLRSEVMSKLNFVA